MRLPIALIAAAGLLVVAGCEKKPKPEAASEVGPPTLPSESKLEPMTELPPAEPLTELPPRQKSPAEAPSSRPGTIEPPPRPKLPGTAAAPAETFAYTVKRGDTLYSLARRFLGKGSRWKEITAVNPGLTPQNLQAGQTIKIPRD